MRTLLSVLLVVTMALAGCHGVGTEEGAAPAVQFGSYSLPAGSPALQPARDCDGLLTALNGRLLEETDTQLDQSMERHRFWYSDTALVADSAGADDAAPAETLSLQTAPGRAADADVTGTNNQEASVDEADVLKTDGEWTYVLRGNRVHILHSETVGDVEAFSTIDLGSGHHGVSILLEPRDPNDPDDDRLVVMTSTWQSPNADDQDDDEFSTSGSIWRGGTSFTRLQVYDLLNRSAPDLISEHWIEGHVAGARLVDGTAYLVVTAYAYRQPLQAHVYPDSEHFDAWGVDRRDLYDMDPADRRELLEPLVAAARAENHKIVANLTLEDHLPQMLQGDPDGALHPVPYDNSACKRFLMTDDGTGRTTTTLLSLSVATPTIWNQVTQVTGSSPIVYAAEDALVLASASRDSWWFWSRDRTDEATDLHWFDLDGLDVTHRASGRTPGIVQDSFGLDVHDGHLRVTTTTGQWGRWWVEDPEPMMNHLIVYDANGGDLIARGNVSGIAPGERIWASRFTDDRAYMITFEQIDPLWIIDLSDPTRPQILGELEIPGVSTYIHPLSEDTLLAIGMGPRADGQGLDWGRLQVSLFDISDPAAPRRADVLDVSPPGGHSWSGAVREHKAFTYWDSIGVLAIPLATNKQVFVGDGQGGHYRYDHHVGLRLIDVDASAGTLRLRGDVDQNSLLPGDDGYGFRYGGASIERSYFLGFPDTGEVSVYAMGGLGMTAHDLSTLKLQDAVAFDDESR